MTIKKFIKDRPAAYRPQRRLPADLQAEATGLVLERTEALCEDWAMHSAT